MTASWRDGLVNAFPIPQDRVKQKNNSKKSHEDNADGHGNASPALAAADETAVLEEPNPLIFFELPAEIRNRIYCLVLFSKPGYRGADGRRKTSPTAMLAVSKRMHQEASYILYSTASFRIFPLQEFTSTPVVHELRPMYRAMVTKLEMVVGSSWTSPPKTWRVSKLLAKRLSRLSAVSTLRVFVQLDPSLPIFAKYRISLDFYTDFCGALLHDVLACMPQLKAVHVDGNPGVDTTGPLVSRLVREAEAKGKSYTIGPNKALATPEGMQRVFC